MRITGAEVFLLFRRSVDPIARCLRISAMNVASIPLSRLTNQPADFAPRRSNEAEEHKTLSDSPLSDQTLWLLAVRDSRDRQAFARLFNYFGPRLKAMLLKQGLRDGRAEDVVQEVMLAVWNKAAQFDPNRAEAAGWIYRIARNRHIDLIRRVPVIEEEYQDTHGGAEPDAYHQLALAEESLALRKAIDALSPEQGELLQKAFLEELPHSEISSLTGLPLGTVKSRIRLGLARIRSTLAEIKQP